MPARVPAAVATVGPAEVVAAGEVGEDEAAEAEIGVLLDDIGGMLHEIRQHPNTRVITWSQARKITRVLEVR